MARLLLQKNADPFLIRYLQDKWDNKAALMNETFAAQNKNMQDMRKKES